MNQSKNKAVIGILIMVFLFFIMLMIFAAYTVRMFKAEENGLGINESPDKIGVVEVEGIIMSSKDTIELIQKAEKDPSVKGIILRINSPGGAVGPTQEIYDEIRRIDQAYQPNAESKGKPIVASFDAIAASGGYYLGAATREIYASPGTITGSIGVIMQFMNLKKLYEFAMLDPQTIKAGRYKDMGQPNRALTEEESALMEDMIEGVHRQFMDDVLKTRKGKIQGNIIDHAQGQIFSGEGAMKIGLVDKMGGLWVAARDLHKELGLKGEVSLKYIKKKKSTPDLIELLGGLEDAFEKLRYFARFDGSPQLLFK